MSTSVAPLTPTYHLWSPTGDKPWYLHQGKLAAALHLYLPLGVTNEGREAIRRQAGRLVLAGVGMPSTDVLVDAAGRREGGVAGWARLVGRGAMSWASSGKLFPFL